MGYTWQLVSQDVIVSVIKSLKNTQENTGIKKSKETLSILGNYFFQNEGYASALYTRVNTNNINQTVPISSFGTSYNLFNGIFTLVFGVDNPEHKESVIQNLIQTVYNQVLSEQNHDSVNYPSDRNITVNFKDYFILLSSNGTDPSLKVIIDFTLKLRQILQLNISDNLLSIGKKNMFDDNRNLICVKSLNNSPFNDKPYYGFNDFMPSDPDQYNKLFLNQYYGAQQSQNNQQIVPSSSNNTNNIIDDMDLVIHNNSQNNNNNNNNNFTPLQNSQLGWKSKKMKRDDYMKLTDQNQNNLLYTRKTKKKKKKNN